MRERAIVYQSPTTLERAIACQPPISSKRATRRQSPNPSERASISQTPKGGKRAICHQSPILSERVTHNRANASARDAKLHNVAMNPRLHSRQTDLSRRGCGAGLRRRGPDKELTVASNLKVEAPGTFDSSPAGVAKRAERRAEDRARHATSVEQQRANDARLLREFRERQKVQKKHDIAQTQLRTHRKGHPEQMDMFNWADDPAAAFTTLHEAAMDGHGEHTYIAESVDYGAGVIVPGNAKGRAGAHLLNSRFADHLVAQHIDGLRHLRDNYPPLYEVMYWRYAHMYSMPQVARHLDRKLRTTWNMHNRAVKIMRDVARERRTGYQHPIAGQAKTG